MCYLFWLFCEIRNQHGWLCYFLHKQSVGMCFYQAVYQIMHVVSYIIFVVYFSHPIYLSCCWTTLNLLSWLHSCSATKLWWNKEAWLVLSVYCSRLHVCSKSILHCSVSRFYISDEQLSIKFPCISFCHSSIRS